MTNAKKVSQILVPAILVLGGNPVNAEQCQGEDPGKSPQVSQRIALLERLLKDSEPVRRAEQSGDEAALQKLAEARSMLAQAQQSFAEDCLANASTLSSEGLNIAMAAFKSNRPTDRGQRDVYEANFQQAQSFLLSLESQPRELWGMSSEDLTGIERQLERAESLAEQGSFDGATRLLLPVNDRLQRRLFEILNEKTLYYEKVFATPADEFAYLKEQYNGYGLLLESGQGAASYSAANRVKTLLDSARQIYAEADRQAQAGQWPAAIASMEAALEKSEQAVRATGYSY